jgi:hypothetical protein
MDIIILIYLCIQIGRKAALKGLSAGRWRWYTVIAWIGAEIGGFMLGIELFGNGNLFGLLLFAFACAVGGYLLVRYQLEKTPTPE